MILAHLPRTGMLTYSYKREDFGGFRPTQFILLTLGAKRINPAARDTGVSKSGRAIFDLGSLRYEEICCYRRCRWHVRTCRLRRKGC
jgi:hypothetical protein